MPSIKAKVGPPNSFSISNIKSKKLEKKAEALDVSGKGYLTFDELVALYQAEKGGALPNLSQLAKFLGVPQHKLETEHLDGWEALSSQWFASNWKGDFHISGFSDDPGYAPAGNVRTGRQLGPQWSPDGTQNDVDQYVFLVDFNFMDIKDFDGQIKNAVIVVGPRDFPAEDGSKYGEMVEVPLTIATQESYQSQGRYGPGDWVPEKKLLAAQVDVGDLRKLAGDTAGLSFFARLELNDGRTVHVNKDGKAFANFAVDKEELNPPGDP
ncbi:MAG: hypothetical protein HY791_23805 [Deltaproteobacteria bacterium]|nr:hypothetical protein [Deltaproteobacteria bacterium]